MDGYSEVMLHVTWNSLPTGVQGCKARDRMEKSGQTPPLSLPVSLSASCPPYLPPSPLPPPFFFSSVSSLNMLANDMSENKNQI